MARRTVNDSESFRRAAASLATSMADGGFRSVMIASATHGEGCTTVVHEIAARLAQDFHLRTLVVELDLDSPGYAADHGLEGMKGVAAIAAGEQSARDCVQQTRDDYAIIPGHDPGKADGRRVDLAATVRTILGELESEYDCVLLDTPPVSDRADVLRVCAVVPRLLMVVEAGRTRSEVIERVRRQLDAEGVTILGAVLNKQRRYIPRWIYRWLVG